MNIYQKAIELLVSEGWNVLQVVNPDNSCLYFVAHEFQESYNAPAQSVDFCTFKGINITDFMDNNVSNPQRHIFMANFNNLIQTAQVIRCQFSKDIKWLKWSSANK